MPIQVGTEDSACSIWNDLGASMLATYLFRGRRWRERQEAGPLLAPAHLRHHEACRGSQRLPARGQHGDLGRDAGGLLRQEADAGPENGDRGDEVQGTVICRWQQNQ